MRSKLMTGALVATIGFLLATNPVVVNAAGQITSGQIKNNTIKSKDIKDNQIGSGDVKNGSLTRSDLAAGTVPAPVVKRFLSGTTVNIPDDGTRVFLGPTVTVTVDGNDAIVAVGSMQAFADTDGSDLDFSVCSRPVGSATEPQAIGGADALADDIDLRASVNNEATALARSVSDVPAAGSYTVGMCGESFDPEVDADQITGWVQVLPNVAGGVLAKPGPSDAGQKEG